MVGTAPSDRSPHVTIVHPRTSAQGHAAWSAIRYTSFEGDCLIDEIAVTAFDGTRWLVVASHRLGPVRRE
jgi:hypothetical protein